MESIEFLERIANRAKPPMALGDIERKKKAFDEPKADKKALRKDLLEMEAAFRGRGDLSSWRPEVLDEIDRSFVRNYMPEGDPEPCLFVSNDADNLNRFTRYFLDVDDILRSSGDRAPLYAREYFRYYSIWQMREYKFPVPLGTASVVLAINRILVKVPTAFSEVSPRISSPRGIACRPTHSSPFKGHILVRHDGELDALAQSEGQGLQGSRASPPGLEERGPGPRPLRHNGKHHLQRPPSLEEAGLA